MTKDLRQRTIAGISWSALAQVVNQCFTFAISIVLARVLGPRVYGLVGMVMVFTGFAAIFGDLGLGAALIQRKELEPRHLNAAFWANVMVGAGMTLIMGISGPLVALFYREPALSALTAAISLRFLIDSLNVVQIALLNRTMQFRRLAAIQVASQIASGAAGLGMALCGMGPWSLVAQSLGGSLVSLLLAWQLEGWRPCLSFEWKACRELFGFSAYVLAFNIVNYWARTFDQLVIGRFVGVAALGIYSRAYNLMLMPLSQVSTVVGRVMFPALSAIQEDKIRAKRAYLKSLRIIALVTFPMMMGAFAISHHLILGLLGDKWAAAVPIFNLFCWVGLLQSIGTTVGLLSSQGRTGLYFTIGAIGSVLCVLGVVIGIQWGIIGVAWSYLIYNLVMWYPCWSIPARFIDLSFSEIIAALRPTFLCALLMGGSVWMVGSLLPITMAHWVHLAIQVPLGVIVYVTLAARLRLESWQEGRQALSEMLTMRLKFLKHAGERALVA